MNSSSPSQRSIRLVQDLSSSGKPTFFMAGPMLDAMGAEELALARRRPYFCGHCGAPVRIRVRSVASSGDTGGRRAHFVHAFGTGTNCPATTERTATVQAVQARRFDGKQEGPRHFHLKTSLCAAIVSDPAFQSAGCELSVRAPSGSLLRPDVLAISAFGPVAFDVQLSPPLIDTIKRRDTAYDPSWMPHAWVIDGRNTNLMNLQGFQDLIAPQGGKILAWDENCAALTLANHTLSMKVISATDAGDQITARVDFVTGEELKSLLGLHACSPAMFADFHALACFEAASHRDPRRFAHVFNARVDQEAAINAADIVASGIMPLVGALVSSTGSRRFPPSQVHAFGSLKPCEVEADAMTGARGTRTVFCALGRFGDRHMRSHSTQRLPLTHCSATWP